MLRKNDRFADITDEKLKATVDFINNRLEKCLGFRSPAELLLNFL